MSGRVGGQPVSVVLRCGRDTLATCQGSRTILSRGRIAIAAAVLGAAGCVELGLVGDIAFAPRVPGLAADQPWVSLPVGAWLTETGIEPRAVSACFAETCQPRAVVALLRARGAEARDLLRTLDDPAALARTVAGRRREAPNAKRPPAEVSVERRREGALAGLALRIARPDGTRPAYGYALAARRGDTVDAVLIVAETDDGARRLAREIAPHLP